MTFELWEIPVQPLSRSACSPWPSVVSCFGQPQVQSPLQCAGAVQPVVAAAGSHSSPESTMPLMLQEPVDVGLGFGPPLPLGTGVPPVVDVGPVATSVG